MKFVLSFVVTVALLSVTVVPALAVSDKANNKACFGQLRASTADGSVIAARKGANAAQNAIDKAACAQPTPPPVVNGGYPAVWADAPAGTIIDAWGFYNRTSASYVAFKIAQAGGSIPYAFGNPKQWPAQAAALGIPVSSTPAVGDAAVSVAGFYGHAMYVESVHADGSITVSDYNRDLIGNYAETVLSPAQVSVLKFIDFY